LSHEIEEQVWRYLKKIDEMGGAISAIEKGLFQKEIEEAAYQYQKEIETKEKIIVGRNEFKSDDKVKIETVKVNPEEEERQVRKLIKMKKGRDGSKVQKYLGVLKNNTLEGKNVIPATLGAVKAYATIGEICHIWKDVFGESKEVYLK
jgi:methylmalonyl-CoA mutase N-terminal domain/subunit